MENGFEQKTIYIIVIVVSLLVVFLIGMEIGSKQQNTTVIRIQSNESITNTNTGANYTSDNDKLNQVLANQATAFSSLILPGIDSNQQGVIARLNIEKKNGTGKTFIEFGESQPTIALETFESIKNATQVVKTISSKANANYWRSNLLYSFETNSDEVAGSSAGAAITIGTLALLENKKLNASIAITGGINSDGSISRVGGVLEKARALKNTGSVTTLFVPIGEAQQEITTAKSGQTCTEQSIGNGTFTSCRNNQTLETRIIDISNETGIRVVEVANIATAYLQMIQQT